MTEPEDPLAAMAETELSRERSRLFWVAVTVAILALLLVCAALIMIAARG